jgi:N-acetylglutamate synthase-like GNAT family acetyltransferase
MKTTIRRARPTDAVRLTRTAHAAKRHWGYPERLIRRWRPALTVTRETIRHEPVYCAIHDGALAGFCAVSGSGDTRELEHMWVHPDFIGRGVGRRLFTYLLARLRGMHVRRLEIASDPNAAAFYRRMGARRIGRVPSTPRRRYLPLFVVRLEPRRARPTR